MYIIDNCIFFFFKDFFNSAELMGGFSCWGGTEVILKHGHWPIICIHLNNHTPSSGLYLTMLSILHYRQDSGMTAR